MSVQVTFDVREPQSHLVTVKQRFPATKSPDRTFRMAAWVPGSYKIRDFGRHVQDMQATVAGKPVKVEQTGKDAWTVRRTQGKVVELRFRVYCRELTVDTSHVTADHAHLFPATLVVYDEASRPLPHRVTVRPPRGWRSWSGLEDDGLAGRLEQAADYDHLIDYPIEVAPPERITEARFTVRRKLHRMVIWNAPDGIDIDRITRDVKAVVAATADLFGGLPYRHYTFIAHAALEHGGGLEHRNSTVLGIDPVHLLDDEDIKQRFLPLVAHEFFHTWNVKRIVPAAFDPYDLQREVYTDLLWLFEGFTTYYELPLLARAGVVDDKAFGNLAARLLEYYEMALGRHHRSVSDCSRLTWTLLYQPHEHNVNRNVSYYTKGLWIGLCLDAHLRKAGVKDGLDAVMRHMWDHHAETGMAEDAFPALVKAATGIDVTRLIARWSHGTSELPIDASLRFLGWDVTREHKDKEKPRGLGVHFKKGTSTIERIPEDSPAGGVLQPDDELIAVDGMKWTGERFAKLANLDGAGDGNEPSADGARKAIDLTVFREGRLRTFKVPLRTLAKDKVTITPRKGDAAATRRRKAWLGQSL